MNAAAAVLTALGLASTASAASAADPVSDTDYLRAARCRGLAVGLGLDASALTAFMKAQDSGRAPYIDQRADEELARAKREAHGDAKRRLTAEFNSSCTAYLGPSKAVAVR